MAYLVHLKLVKAHAMPAGARFSSLPHIRICIWWASRSPHWVKDCSPGGHLNKDRTLRRLSAAGYRRSSVENQTLHSVADGKDLFLQPAPRKPLNSFSNHRSEQLPHICPFFFLDCAPISWSEHRSVIAAESRCPPLCPTIGWQCVYVCVCLGGWGDFVKHIVHQDVGAAPAEVSHPLLTMALLASPVTCELGNERRGGAVIYITNVRVLRTWTHLISLRLISLPDQTGMHNTSDGQ